MKSFSAESNRIVRHAHSGLKNPLRLQFKLKAGLLFLMTTVFCSAFELMKLFLKAESFAGFAVGWLTGELTGMELQYENCHFWPLWSLWGRKKGRKPKGKRSSRRGRQIVIAILIWSSSISCMKGYFQCMRWWRRKAKGQMKDFSAFMIYHKKGFIIMKIRRQESFKNPGFFASLFE